MSVHNLHPGEGRKERLECYAWTVVCAGCRSARVEKRHDHDHGENVMGTWRLVPNRRAGCNDDVWVCGPSCARIVFELNVDELWPDR